MNRFLRVATLVVFAVHGAMALAAPPPLTCSTISLAPASLPNGDLATAYKSTVTSSGGAAPIVIDITHGTLPTGVNLTDNGDGTATFSGTATQTGSFEFTITATDANGCSGGRTYATTFAAATQTISFTSTAPVGATVGGPTYNVTATATSGLPVAFTIDATASSVCSIAGSTVSFIGVGTCVIDANQPGNAAYGPAPQVQQNFAVGQGAQTITFTSTAPAAATVGGATYNVTATASSGLPVTLTIDASASAVCSIAGSTVSFTGVGTCVIDANQAGNANYAAAPQVQQSFAVGQGSQTITFTSTAPVAATVGGPTYNVTATATSGLTVTFTIDATATSVCSIAGSTVSFLAAGTCVIDANQAGNANYTAAPQVQQSFAVGKANQTISFTSTAPAAATVGGPTYNVTATATSGLVVALTIDASASSVCTLAGSTVSFIGVGTCVIDANQAGDANYNAAPQVQQSFAVGKGNQTITFTSAPPASPTVGGPTYTVTATASSGLPVTFSSATPSTCTVTGSTVTFIAAGTCTVNADQAGNANYNAAPQVQQTMTVGQGSQTITFTSTAPASATFSGPTYTVTATATSGLAVTFTIDATASTVCSISGSTVSFIGVGTCVIDANQAGNANYNAAPQVQQSFAVAKSNQTISFTSTAPAGAQVGGATYTVTATATSGLVVALTIDATASTVCTIAGSTVSFIGAGTCVIDANQAGNANYNAATQVQQSFVVTKQNQTISFTSTAPATAKNGGATYTVTATATSGLAVTFSSATPTICSVVGSTVTFIGAGTCTINADQAGNATYNPAPQVQQSFLVAKGDQTITITSTPPAFGATVAPNHTYNVTATASSGLTVVFSIDATSTTVCSIAGNMVTFNNPGTCTIDFNQPGDVNWNPAPQLQQSVTVLAPANAVADSHAVTGNVRIAPAAANGVLTNDTGTSIVIQSYGKTTGAEQTTIGNPTPTLQNGTITLNADGSYTYVPPVNFTGADSFKYIIDNALVRPSTGTVTLNVTDRIIIVSLAGGGTCDPVTPSPCTLAVADAAPIATGKDLVFVESATYPGAVFTLFVAQNLVGQQVSLAQAITDIGGITLAADSATLATIAASTRPVFNNAATVITLGGGNLIEYFNINPSAGAAISGAAAVTGTTTANSIVITSSGTANAIALVSQAATHTFNLDSASSITHSSSGAAVSLTGVGGQGPANIAAPISSTNGSPVTISGRTAGTVAFTGAISSTGQGVSLTGNTGSTINFSAGINLSTGANAAFTATGGGTVSATQNNTSIVNVLTTTTGTALNVTGTTIGAAGLTFRSITSNGGSSDGIILNATGASGGTTVTGNGGACASAATCTGGAISNKTGADGSATQGSGIFLSSTSGVSLDRMQLNDFQNFAVRGLGVTGFSLTNSNITGNNGTNSAGGSREGDIGFDGLFTSGAFPTAQITNSVLGGTSFSDIVRVTNTSGTLNRLVVSNNTFGVVGINGNEAFQTDASNNAVLNVTANDNVLGNTIGTLINVIANNSSSVDAVVRRNKLSNNNVNAASGAAGIFITGDSVGTASTVTYDVSCNSIKDSIGTALIVAKGNGKGAYTGSIVNNAIGVNGVALSGSTQADGIKVTSNGTGTHVVRIADNVIHQTNEVGLFLQANDSMLGGNGGGQGIMSASVFNNLIDQPGSFSFAGLNVDVGALASDNNVVNVVAGSSSVAAQKNDFSTGDPFNFSDVNFSTIGGAVINLSRNGSASATPALVIRDDNLNPATTNTAVSGTVNLVATLPPTPPVVTACTIPP
jgi:hypothetical protein